MDMTGDMPRQAWVEIYDEECNLLVKLDSHISRGSISTEFPAFAAGTRGRIRDVWIYPESEPPVDAGVNIEELELEDLPTEPIVKVSQIG